MWLGVVPRGGKVLFSAGAFWTYVSAGELNRQGDSGESSDREHNDNTDRRLFCSLAKEFCQM